jgi:Pro-kumamolisin, activation domain
MPAASRTESYSPIEGSERALPATVKLLGPADPDEVMSVTVFLRQRPDGEPLPDFSYYATTPPAARPRLSDEGFAVLYGASDDDIASVVEFARSHGLSVVESHAAGVRSSSGARFRRCRGHSTSSCGATTIRFAGASRKARGRRSFGAGKAPSTSRTTSAA